MTRPFLTEATRTGPALANRWPCYRVSPVAYDTPPFLMAALEEYCAAGKALGELFVATNVARDLAGRRPWDDPALKAALRAEAEAGRRFKHAADQAEDFLVGYAGYHRVGDELVGVVWRASGPRLDTRPAFTAVTSFPTRGPEGW